MEDRKSKVDAEKAAKWDASIWADETEEYLNDTFLGDPSFTHTTNIKTWTMDI